MSILSRVKTWISGETLTADDLNGEFDNILSNLDPDNVEDASTDATAMQAVADPYPAGSPSLATDLRGELQRLRYILKQITGEAQWYIDPDNTLAALESDMNTAQTNITTNATNITTLQGITNPVLPTNVDDYSATDGQMQTVDDPYPASVISKATTLVGEINRIRYQLQQILGETYWYIDADASIATLNTRTQAATTSASGIAELATSAEVVAWTDTGRTITPSGLGSWAKYGYIWLPATCFDPTDTAGATWGLTEYKAQYFEGQYYAFNGATLENISTVVCFPEQWSRTVMWGRVYWAPQAGCSESDTVSWTVFITGIANDEALSYTPEGSYMTMNDVVLAGVEGDLHVTPHATCTLASANAADLMNVRVARNVSGTDDMEEDAYFLGLFLQVSLTNSVAVWS